MAKADLNESASVVLDGSGNGTAKVGPQSAREIWHPKNVSVNTVQAAGTITDEAQCVILVGDVNTRRQRDATQSGSTGDATDKVNADTVKCGEFVWAVWTGGDAGVTAIVTVTGEKDV